MTSPWWQRGVIYQIYPRSFQDSNGNGVGDLTGTLRRLDYCAGLGVDALWLSPIYPSPMADFGYDVSDYTDVHPLFGTLEQFDELVARSSDLLAYIRRSPYGSLLIALNLGGGPFDLTLGSLGVKGRVILSTYLDRVDKPTVTELALRADEGVIVKLTGPPLAP